MKNYSYFALDLNSSYHLTTRKTRCGENLPKGLFHLMNIQKHDQHTFDKDNSQFNVKWDVTGLSILHFISLIGLFQNQ